MPRRIWLVAALVVVAVGVGIWYWKWGRQPRWSEQSFPDANFKAKFPGKATYEKNPKGEQSYGAGDSTGNMFIVSWSESPTKNIEVISTFADVAASFWKNSIIKQERKLIKLGPHPGIEQRLELDTGLAFRERFFLIGPTLFRLQLATKKEGLDSANANSFFDSFALINEIEPVPGATEYGPSKEDNPAPGGKVIREDDPHPPRDLMSLGQMYTEHSRRYQKPPYDEHDLARVVGAKVQETAVRGVPEQYVLIWGVDIDKATDQDNTILGYESGVPTKGGLVLLISGRVTDMTTEQFRVAPKAKEGKRP